MWLPTRATLGSNLTEEARRHYQATGVGLLRQALKFATLLNGKLCPQFLGAHAHQQQATHGICQLSRQLPGVCTAIHSAIEHLQSRGRLPGKPGVHQGMNDFAALGA
ncbi:MAG: hypothetical protein BWY63_03857 [Chloroflexi bacterium ADurb.Bin360]|nr:MAG: hypothetical protein BWY63_03857 [Chloroflexi bacterium ADurb.Bin360]